MGMRLWHVDMSQHLPCGNILRFVRPSMRAWEVSPGSTSKDTNVMCLRSEYASKDASLVPWICTASKKVAEHISEGAKVQMYKNIICCGPEKMPAGAQTNCCAEKTLQQ